jgi:hypothetical protein
VRRRGRGVIVTNRQIIMLMTSILASNGRFAGYAPEEYVNYAIRIYNGEQAKT